jgi:rSAM/selenodomain-associated transferase 2
LRPLLRVGRRELLGLNLSVIIPALNVARTLPACMARLEGASEVIMVDGGSTDDTRQIGEEHGAKVLSAPKGRGVQLRAGAEAAQGAWLLFLHADTLLDAGWLEAVRRHMADAPGTAASFRFALASPAWQARLIEAGVAARVRLFGLPYGDQGLLVPRSLYEEIGGYKPMPLMEDIDLVRRIGRRRLRVLDADAVTSAERWQREGWLRRSGRNLLCLGLYEAGLSAERVAKLYDEAPP